jgi:hypothetical protein
MTIEPKLTTRWGQIARTAGLALLWAGLVLGSGAAVATESDAQPPYPVWWSPVLELDSLDAIDARLARALWEHDPEGMTLYKSEGDTRLEIEANSCHMISNDLSKTVMKVSVAADTGFANSNKPNARQLRCLKTQNRLPRPIYMISGLIRAR